MKRREETTHVAWTRDMGLVRVFFARRSPPLGFAGLAQESRIGHRIGRGEDLGFCEVIRVAHVGCGDGG